ncbi:LacI family DNA-binding transcriptional regulator [Nocardioides fonticola]|uniref:LacI family DNA-binding transcriptional regulator n=1 Tax=Nocardioides fonticola TaxID=450363 RepID=A0ABP7XFR2_9ACTN
MTRERRATITDVARAAGVATSTVSRAFTRPQRVNAATREHVLRVADELGYVPNPAARAMGTGRTQTLALLVPDLTNPFFSGIITGAEQAAARAGRTLVVADTQESPEREQHLLTSLDPAVDGFVVAASRLPDDALREAAARSRIVLLNRATPGLPAVVADYESGTRQVVEHLASLGHRELVFLGGPVGSWSGARRWAGLQRACADLGVQAVRWGPYSPTLAGGPGAADAALAAGARAVVCHNDMLAIGVLRRLAERGVAVPADISVVGFDDIFGADFCHPPLTTLAERTRDAGSAAVGLLISAETDGVTALPTELRVRASSGPPRS